MIATFPQAEVVTAFGQTECSPVTAFLRGEDSMRKIGSVGTPMLNVEVRVVDEAMRDVPRGEVGEIVYRGPMVMTGYWGKPEETAEAFEGGWFHSGDLVREDEDGYLYVVDRKKDMIISGGENIYCAEVEDVLAAHPKVAEVALIGVPDSRVRRGAAGRRRPARPGRPADARGAHGLVPGAAGPRTRTRASIGGHRAAAQPERQGAQDGAARGARRGLPGRLPRSVRWSADVQETCTSALRLSPAKVHCENLDAVGNVTQATVRCSPPREVAHDRHAVAHRSAASWPPGLPRSLDYPHVPVGLDPAGRGAPLGRPDGVPRP